MDMFNYLKLGLITSLAILTSCEKEPIPPGIESVVFGQIYDSTNDLPIENIKIRLAEYRAQGTFSGINYNFQGYIDSAITDSNGDYRIPFSTTGNGNKYSIQLEYNIAVHIPNLEEYIEDENIGNQEEINFEALRLYPVDLRINILDEIDNPIFIYKQFPENQILPIESSIRNATRRVWVDKNVENQINFRIESISPYLNYYINFPISSNTDPYEIQVPIRLVDFQ